MKPLILCLCLFFSFSGFGQLFGPEQLISWSNYNDPRVQDIHTADLDEDGDLDLVFIRTSLQANKIFICWNNGGTFSLSSLTDELNGPTKVLSGDIDGDGDLDIVSSSLYGNHFIWFENEGNGSFSDPIIISDNLHHARTFALADLNNDNQLDIFYKVSIFNTIGWLRNLGGGDFASHQHIPYDLDDDPVSVFTEDIDGDLDIDVLIGSFNGIGWLSNQDNFSNLITQSVTEVDPFVVSMEDLDNDGFKDIIGVSSTNKIVWFRNHLNEYFEAEQIITTNTDGTSEMLTGDMNNDGLFDIIFISRLDDKIKWIRNEGGGSFSETLLITDEFLWPWSLDLADIDLDGDLDIIAGASFFGNGNPSDGELVWFENLLGAGCTDVEACNYDPLAEIDNNTCHYDIPFSESNLITNETCEGDSLLFIVEGDSLNAYQWISDGVFISDQDSVYQKFVDNGTYEIELISQNQFCSTYQFQTITVYEYPTIEFSTESIEICSDQSIELEVSGENIQSINWIFNTEIIGTEPSLSYEFNDPGVYEIQLETQNEICTNSNYKTVTVYQTPTVTISQNGDLLTSSEGDAYQWFLNGEAIEGATNQEYSVLEDGTYTVEVTNGGLCTGTSEGVMVVSISELNEETIILYPNPMVDRSFLEFENSAPRTIRLMDSSGKVVKIWNSVATPRIEITRDELAAGIYVVSVNNGSNSRNIQLIIK